MANLGEKLADQAADQMIREIDVDGDGQINFEEIANIRVAQWWPVDQTSAPKRLFRSRVKLQWGSSFSCNARLPSRCAPGTFRRLIASQSLQFRRPFPVLQA
ncbi:unnamed protein product [Prorocentrum cordatum]|uniref:EF-hand domain-containing protein n=1 Tax=Prorocentrum cordatum TaxID=2364126 RepID=A0ABN9UU89_9DINO|nr:unnamed protein product [Polarella glacialis]